MEYYWINNIKELIYVQKSVGIGFFFIRLMIIRLYCDRIYVIDKEFFNL